ncbi:MAG: glycosyltransferase family 39 protein [Acidobacteriota bacterium]
MEIKSIFLSLKRYWLFLTILILMIFGLYIRIAGTGAYYMRPEDWEILDEARHHIYGSFRPINPYSYPVFYQYIVAIIFRALGLIFSILGAIPKGITKIWSYYELSTIARILSGFYGTISIYITYLVGKKLYNQKAGILSAIFLTLSFNHIILGHSAVLDNQMGLFAIITFLFCVGIYLEGKLIYYIFSGIFAGFAIASKYNGGMILVALIIAHILYSIEKEKNIIKTLFHKKLFIAIFFTIFGFFIGAPYFFIEPGYSLKKLIFYIGVLSKPDWWMTPVKPDTLIEKIIQHNYFRAILNINYSIGLPFSILILIGFIKLFKLRKKEILLFSFPILYILIALGSYGISRPRDLFVLLPFLALIQSLGFVLIWDFLRKYIDKRIIRNSVLTLALMIIFIPTLFRDIEAVYYIKRYDTVELAHNWIEKSLPENSKIAFEMYSPLPDDKRYKHYFGFFFILGFRDFSFYRNNFDFLIVSSINYKYRFYLTEKYHPNEVRFYRGLNREYELIKDFSLKLIEMKNPTVKLYKIRKIGKKPVNILLPKTVDFDRKKIDYIFTNPDIYGKCNNVFFLKDEELIRYVQSNSEIGKCVLFFYGENQNEIIKFKNGYSTHRVDLGRKGMAYLEISPKLKFPFTKYVYKFIFPSIEGKKEVLVKILWNPMEIGYEFYKNEHYDKAIEYYQRELEKNPENIEAYYYLSLSNFKKGMYKDANQILYKINKKLRLFDRSYLSLTSGSLKEEEWKRKFERLFDVDFDFFLDSHSVILQMEDFDMDKKIILNDEKLSFLKGLYCDSEWHGENSEIESSSIQLYPQEYIAELSFKDLTQNKDWKGRVYVLSNENSKEKIISQGDLKDGIIENDFKKIKIHFKINNMNERVKFRIILDGNYKIILDKIRIFPDLRIFFFEMGKDIFYMKSYLNQQLKGTLFNQ